MREALPQLEQQLAALAREPGAEIERVGLLIKMCEAFRDTDEWDRLRATAEEARRLSESVGHRAGVATAIAHGAFVPYILSDFQAAIPEAVNALRLAEECGSKEAECQACAILALVNWSLGDLDAAVRFGERTRQLAEATGHRVMMAYTYLIRGSISHGFGDLQEALNWAVKSARLFEEDDRQLGLSRALVVQGSVYRAMGEIEKALDVTLRALTLAEEFGNQLAISRALNDVAAVYRDLGLLQEALKAYQAALDIRRREKYRSAEITTLLDLAELHKLTNDRNAAIAEGAAAVTLAAELGVKPKLSQAHRLLAELFESAGNFRQAIVHLKEHQTIHASIASDQAAARLRTSELITSLERLRAEQAAVVESEKRSALANLAGTLAHEMNSPLGALHSSCDATVRCVDKLVKAWDGNGKSVSVTDLLDILKKNADVMTGATKRVQSVFELFRNFSEWKDEAEREMDVAALLEQALTMLAPRADVVVRREFAPAPQIPGHAAEIGQVFLQLLANAEASIAGAGEIRVTIKFDGARVTIEIADTGRGIDPERLPKLFEPGFSLGGARVKASFSLFACQHIIRKHGGEIRVSSLPGQGSVFTVVLPRDVAALGALPQQMSAQSRT